MPEINVLVTCMRLHLWIAVALSIIAKKKKLHACTLS